MRLKNIFFAMATIFAVVSGAEAKKESWSAEKAVQRVCSGAVSGGAPNGPMFELDVSSIYSGLRFRSDYAFEPVDAPLWKACMNDREQDPLCQALCSPLPSGSGRGCPEVGPCGASIRESALPL